MNLKAASIMGGAACLLVFAISWGKSAADFSQLHSSPSLSTWSPGIQLLTRAWAGAVPGLAADTSILKIFDIYDRIRTSPEHDRDKWWDQLSFYLHKAQSMDPYFKDAYRLTEGLLAYEGKRTYEAIGLLSASEKWLNSADPLIAASSLAHYDLNDDKLAIALATKAINKPDAQDLTIGFATSLIRQNSGCREAIAFMYSRLKLLPERYRQGITNRIKRYQHSKICARENGRTHAH